MIANDFMYDGMLLSNWGYIICDFNSTPDTSSDSESGSLIKIATVPIEHNAWNPKVNSSYDSVISATFDICKDPCVFDDDAMTQHEVRQMFSWLNRPSFLPFKLCNEYHRGINFNATFNVQKIELSGKVIGLRLNCTTDKPFGLGDEIKYARDFKKDKEYYFANDNDGDGIIYPKCDITMQTSGDLDLLINNNYHVIVKNVTNGEVIHMHNPIISTSVTTHSIQDDFNWNFFRLDCKYNTVNTILKSNLDCHIEYKYQPIVKFGF